jgi:hypothetical protein
MSPVRKLKNMIFYNSKIDTSTKALSPGGVIKIF